MHTPGRAGRDRRCGSRSKGQVDPDLTAPGIGGEVGVAGWQRSGRSFPMDAQQGGYPADLMGFDACLHSTHFPVGDSDEPVGQGTLCGGSATAGRSPAPAGTTSLPASSGSA